MNNKLEAIKKRIPLIAKLLHHCKEGFYIFLGKHYPETLIKIWYKHKNKRNIDLINPKTLDEKINWMKLHSDISLWTKCADKIEVRKYIEERGLGHVLNTMYGVYERAEDIDFDALPESFVLKTSNGGGGKQVLIVKNKADLNISETRKLLKGWLKQEVGYRYYEPQYFDIKPRIIAEKYLQPDDGEGALNDYKINCFDGKAYSIVLCSERKFNDSVFFSVYDLDWNLHTDCILNEYRTSIVYPKPVSLEKMIEYSSILAKGIPFVRIDWYEIKGEPIISEMTFTPSGGFQHLYSYDYLLELGEQLTLPSVCRM